MCEQSKFGQPGERDKQTPGKQGEGDIKKDLNPNPIAPPSVHSKINPAPIAPQNAAREKQHSRQGWKEFNWWKERGELVAFVAAIVIMVINFRQWRDAHEQLAESRKAYRLDERAWVTPSPVNPLTTDPISAKPSIVYILHFKNSGRTPAINSKANLGATLDYNSIPESEPIPNTSAQLIPPNGESQVVSPPVSAGVIQEALGKAFFVYGTIWYDDIFGNHHWTQFCWSVDVRANVTYPALKHNGCDMPDDAEAKKPK